MNLPELFRNYLLEKKGSSPVTAKNYVSDLRKFIAWFEESFGKVFESRDLTPDVIELFQKTKAGKLVENQNTKYEILDTGISPRSLERYLSSLRRFARFLTEENLIESNPFDQLSTLNSQLSTQNDPWHIKDFRDYLYVFGASRLTIKNYVVDINAFTTWADEAQIKYLPALPAGRQVGNYIEIITSDIIEEYKERLISILNLSPKTVNRKLSSIRKYLEFATAQGHIRGSTPLGVEPLRKGGEISKNEEGISLDDLRESENNKSSIINNQYSKFPPVRLLQKLLVPYELFEDLIASRIAAFVRNYKLAQKAKGFSQIKSVFSQIRGNQLLKFLPAGRRARISNIPKEMYAPHEISLEGFSWHQKAYHHLRYTRPKWYKKYHTYSFIHYFHFAILVVYASAVGFIIYTNLFAEPQKKLALAAPTAPPRILSFQGRLTDQNDNPITTATDIRFQIYDHLTATGSGNLLWQEVIEITPDQDGIFSELLGNGSTCSGQPLTVQQTRCAIPASVFTDNATLYLGITIEATAELTPRQQLATVAYAANAESLQGMLPITDAAVTDNVNTVLVLDSSANLTMDGATAPTFQATGGQFKLSGQPLLLTTSTGTNNNVIVDPDGLGKLDVRKPLINTTATGDISPGGVTINDKVGILATESAVAAFVINNDTTGGDIFTASSSGTTRFTIENDGDVRLVAGVSLDTISTGTLSIGGTTATTLTIGRSGQGITLPGFTATNGVLYGTDGSGVLAQATTSTQNLCLVSGASAPSWSSCASAAGDDWTVASGAIFPNLASTLDFLLGSTATASAEFAVTGINDGTPTATISATAGGDSGNGISLTGSTATIQSLRMNTLTIGGSTTGNIVIDSGSNITQFNDATINTNQATLALFDSTATTVNFARGTTTTLTIGATSGTLSLQHPTINVGAGAAATIATVSNDDLTLTPQGTGELTLSSDFDTPVNVGLSTNTPAVLSVAGGIGSNAGFIVNRVGTTDDIIAASSSGTTRMTLSNAGVLSLVGGQTADITSLGNANLTLSAGGTGELRLLSDADTDIVLPNFNANNNVLYATVTTGVLAGASTDTSNQCLLSGASAPSWGSCGAATTDVFWGQSSGLLYPNNSTVDLTIGGQSTASAKFAFINVNSGNPTATISGNLSLVVPTTAGANTFNLLNNSTLNFQRSPGGDAGLATALFIQNNGNVGIGTTAPAQALELGATRHIRLASDGQLQFGANSNGIRLNDQQMVIDASNGGSRLQLSSTFDIVISSATKLNYNPPTFAFQEATTISTPVNTDLTLSNSGTGDIILSPGGNVGIGNTSPLTALDVTGSASLSANLFLRGAATAHTFNILDNGTLNFQRSPGGDAGLATALFIQNNGNVGIGTTSPTQALELGSGKNILLPLYGQLQFGGTATRVRSVDSGTIVIDFADGISSRLQLTGSNQFELVLQGSTRLSYATPNFAFQEATTISTPVNTNLTLSNSGTGDIILSPGNNVGIGTTSPLSVLHVEGGNTGGRAALIVNQTGASSNDLLAASASGTTKLRVLNDGTIRAPAFYDIDNTSYFLDPAATAVSLQLVGDASTSGSLVFDGTNKSIDILNGSRLDFQTSPGGDAGLTARMTILNNGNVGIGTTNPGAKLHVAGTTSIFGEGEGGTPTATTLRGAAASGSNIAGANLTFDASTGTGTGGSGALIFRTAPTTAPPPTFDATSSTTGSSVSSLTWAHVVGNGSNRALVVGVSIHKETNPRPIVSSVTFNTSESFTKVGSIANDGKTSVEIWRLLNPTVTTANIVVTLDNTATNVVGGATSWFGVDQTTPTGTFASANGNNTAPSVNVSSASDEIVVDTVATLDNITVGTSQTSRWNRTVNFLRAGGSSEPGASTTTMSWTVSSTQMWTIGAVPLKPGTTATAVSTLAERLRITPSGNVGIGNTSPLWKLQVTDSQAGTASAMIENTAAMAGTAACTPGTTCHTGLIVRLGSDNTNPGSADRFINFMRGDSTIIGKIRGPQTAGASVTYDSNGGDFAEYFKKSNLAEDIPFGSLVCLGDDGGITKCNNQNKNILGVASDITAFLGNGGHDNDPNYVAIGLVGQVPTYLSIENGPIKAGDPLTASSIPGVAAKAKNAGKIVGKALVDYNRPEANIRTNILIQPSWYDPDVYLTSTGDINIIAESSPSADPLFAANQNSIGNWKLEIGNSGEIIRRVGAFAQLAVANLQAGFINAKEITTNSLAITTDSVTIAGQNLRDYIIAVVNESGIINNESGIVSGLASIDQIHTNIISPLGSNQVEVTGDINVEGNVYTEGNISARSVYTEGLQTRSATVSGDLAAQTINADSLQINTDATISGNLSAESVEISENLNARDASISGTLYANNIKASSIEGLEARIASFAAQSVSSNAVSSLQYSVSSESGSIDFIARLNSQYSILNTKYLDIQSISSDFGTFRDGLMALGPATFNQVTALESLSIGTTMMLGPNSIDTLGQDLEIQPLKQGAISFLAGAVRIETDGTLKVSGNAEFAGDVKVEGKLSANIISPLSDQDLAFNLPSSQIHNSEFRIQNSSTSAVLSVNQQGDLVASGSGTFGKLNLSFATPAYATSDTRAVATGSAGIATLKRYRTELTISNPLVTPDSLIYITPVGNSNNQVLYLLRQIPENPALSGVEGSFTVGVSAPALADIKFNWIIVN